VSALNIYGPDRNLSAEQWLATLRTWPALVRMAYIALLLAGCEVGSARRLARGRSVRMEACGYDSDLCAAIVRKQRGHAQLAVRKGIYALALVRAIHPRATA
jgi:hypothetical protein